MPHLEQFFTHGDGAEFCAGPRAPKDSEAPGHNASAMREGGVLYLRGPRDAAQTSLLLQFGFTQVKAGRNVVLVMRGDAGASQQADLVQLTACAKCNLPVQTGETNSFWSSIRIKYLRSSTELQHFVCSLHVVAKEASVLLIAGFEKFFDGSSMGNVYQTLAYMLEAQDYMKTTTGFGVAVVSGNKDAFFLRDRPLLRRWCRFLEIVPHDEEPDVFVLREEVENAGDAGEDVAKIQVTFEFSDEAFQLLHVQTRSG